MISVTVSRERCDTQKNLGEGRSMYLEELGVLIQLAVQLAVLLVVLFPLGPPLLVFAQRDTRPCAMHNNDRGEQ